jgi:hypothetical protein
MRYGSIPDGYQRSMIHLEYDEAQRLELPSLIYIIDEENQPILPKYVETGPGAQKLRELKEQLKKRHMVSLFTSPDDLRARILHDVPEQIKNMGTAINGDLNLLKQTTATEILQQFKKLPKLFSGRPVIIEFVNTGDFRSAYAEECTALGLEIGASVVSHVKINNGDSFYIYGERETALALCNLPKKLKVKARATTAFGVYRRAIFAEDDIVINPEEENGLIIKEITQIGSEQEA